MGNQWGKIYFVVESKICVSNSLVFVLSNCFFFVVFLLSNCFFVVVFFSFELILEFVFFVVDGRTGRMDWMDGLDGCVGRMDWTDWMDRFVCGMLGIARLFF